MQHLKGSPHQASANDRLAEKYKILQNEAEKRNGTKTNVSVAYQYTIQEVNLLSAVTRPSITTLTTTNMQKEEVQNLDVQLQAQLRVVYM